MDNRSPEENWRWTMETNSAHSLSSHRPRKADAESKSPAAAEIPTLHRALASVPERTSLAIRKPIDNLLFLSILLDAVSNDPRVGISEIAERVSMTYQGVVNRLKALDLRLDGPEMAQRIHNRMEEERSQIQPYADWLKHCLQLG
jgi:hypothetical protein